MNIATGTNRVVFSLRPKGAVADGRREEEEMADVEEEEEIGVGKERHDDRDRDRDCDYGCD